MVVDQFGTAFPATFMKAMEVSRTGAESGPRQGRATSTVEGNTSCKSPGLSATIAFYPRTHNQNIRRQSYLPRSAAVFCSSWRLS